MPCHTEIGRLLLVKSSYIGLIFSHTAPYQVYSAFYPPWDGKMSTSQRAVMLCGWGVKAGMV